MPTKEELVEIILAYDVGVGNLETQLSDIKHARAEAERDLVNLMEEESITAFSLNDGRKIERDDKMVLSIRAQDKPNWFDWIDSIGRGDLIKTDINKNSLNAVIKSVLKGKEDRFTLPPFFDMTKDIFLIPRIAIKMGRKSLRKLMSESTADTDSSD